jgi:hypothetical protein
MKNANNASKDGAVVVPVRQGPIRVRVSVLNWNAAEETLACVTSLAALTPRPGMELILRVVDNGSRPEEVARLEAGLPPAACAGSSATSALRRPITSSSTRPSRPATTTSGSSTTTRW